MPPHIANEELSEAEARQYEKFTRMIAENFKSAFSDDDSEDID